jgi:hypothetical protein
MALKKLILGAVAAASVMSAVPASAVQVVFAQIDLLNSDRNFLFRRISGTTGDFYTTSTATSSVPGATQILFSLVGSPTPLSVTANLFLQGSLSGNPAGVTSGPFSQQIDSFSFNITASNSFCWGANCFNAGDSLLSGLVVNSAIVGTVGQTSADLTGSTVGGSTISYLSPLVTFDAGSPFAFNFDLSNLDRALTGGNSTAIGSFRGQISGTFSSEPEPTFNVPEPGTWALMIVGMGLVGVARRRRRKVVAA